MTVTLRRTIGTALTYDQLDDNFVDYTTFRDKFSQSQWIGSNDGKFLFYNNSTGKIELKALTSGDLSGGFSSNFTSLLATKTSDDIAEGPTKLYYTSSRANADFDTRLATKSTTNLSEGSRLYYTDARVDARISALNTDSLSEGSTNLYFTNARADTRIGNASLTTLANVDNVVAGDDGKVLYYDHSTTSFKWKADSFTATLTALTDVAAVTSADNGKVLYYDHPSTSFKWQIDPQKSFNVSSTGITMTAGEQYAFNTNSSPLTVTLPSTAATGQSILIIDAGHYFGTNNLTIGRNGNTINGVASNLILATSGQSVGLLWNGSGWVTYMGFNTAIYG